MKTQLLIFLALCLSLCSYSQDNPTRLVSEGPIPKHFKSLLSEDINREQRHLQEEGKKLNKKETHDFLAVTNFGIQKYIQTGKIIFGDPLTRYANRILNNLKDASDEDIDFIKVYTLRSTEVNAFAIHQGYILITTGLWAHLENEAQLANILAHEIQHITHKHSLNEFQRSLDQISFGQMTKDELSHQFQYKKNLEYEADKEGFLLAQKAGYPDSLLASSMKMLSSSNRPIEEFKVDYSLLEDEYFKIPSHLKLIELEEVTSQWDYNSNNSTHPNAKERYDELKKLFIKKNENKIYPSYNIDDLRDIARRDLLNTYIVNGNYVDGMYHNLILLSHNPDDVYLHETYAMMWYGLSAEINLEFGPRYSYNFTNTSGELERFYFLFHNMKPNEICVMATREVWNASIRNPKSEFLKNLRKKVLSEFIHGDQNPLQNFVTIDKLGELKRQRRKMTKGFKNSLAIVLDRPDFLNELNAARGRLEQRIADQKIYYYTQNFNSTDSKLDNILLAQPLYSKADLRKRISDNLTSNETKKHTLRSMSENYNFSQNVSVNFFGDITESDYTTDDYNDMVLMYDYLQEKIKHYGYDYLPFNSRLISSIEKLDSVGGIGLLSFQSLAYHKRFHGSAAFFSALSVIGFPSYVRWQLEPRQYTYLQVLIFDTKTHNASFRYIKMSDTPLNDYLENAQIYHVFNQLGSRK